MKSYRWWTALFGMALFAILLWSGQPIHSYAQATATAQATAIPGSKDNPLINPCTHQPFATIMTGTGFAHVDAQLNQNFGQQYVINFTLADSDEARRFSKFTATHISQPVAIVLDGQVLSAPVVQAELTTGGIITGNFTRDTARTLAAQLRSGALPAPLALQSMIATQFGVQITLTPAAGYKLSPQMLDNIHDILQKRLDDQFILNRGVSVTPENNFVIEMFGLQNIPATVDYLRRAALLELVDYSRPDTCTGLFPATGQYILTDVQIKRQSSIMGSATQAATQATAIAQAQATAIPGSKDNPLINPCTHQPFVTIMTGAGFAHVEAQLNQNGGQQYVINFTLADNDEARRFSKFTATHLQQPLAIVLDGQVLSAPVIQAELTTGGIIVGSFTRDTATTLAAQLRSGVLPVPLVMESQQQDDFGIRVILVPAPNYSLSKKMADEARDILQKRLGELGIINAGVVVTAENKLLLELHSVDNTQLSYLLRSAFLEFVDFSRADTCTAYFPATGQYVLTDGQIQRQRANSGLPTQAATQSPQ